MSSKLEYRGEYTTKITVFIKYEDDYLMAWEEDCMMDGLDYEPFEQRLKNGEEFESVAKDIVKYLKRKR